MGSSDEVTRRGVPPMQPPRVDAGEQSLRLEIDELRRQNAVLRETLDTIDGSVVVYDQDRGYLLGNQMYHTINPHLPADDELIGRKYEEILALSIAARAIADPEAYADSAAFIGKCVADMEARKSVPRETQNAQPGLEHFNPETGQWFLVHARRTACGKDVSLRLDITAQKRLQTQLQRAREDAEEASRMKSQFLGNVSHELRTPLNAVINFARLMGDQIHGPLGAPQYIDYSQDILESGTHLLGLIDELLDLARAEAGRLSIAESVVDVRRLIATVCRALRPEAAAKHVVLMDVIPQELGNLRGDPTRLRQVLLNLIANAIKFTASGGSVTVAVEHPHNDDLRITVSDNGIGIASQDVPRVMEPFVQVPLPSGISHPGVGLGLPLSRHLIELHGGTLTLHSKAEVGTTVVVTLPASRVFPIEPHGVPRNALT